MFIDTHTHIYTEDFDTDRAEVLLRARQAGAEALLLPNIDEASIAPMLRLCTEQPDFCYPMMGLHPTVLPKDPMPLLDRMEALLSAPNHPYVAVGEVGIDLYWDTSRREEQITVFQRQAEWAIRFDLPLVVHSRSAHRELVDTLRPMASQLRGIFHCFGGTEAEAHELISLFPHFALGIGGILTFRRSTLPSILATTVPLSRLVVETDAPYLAPTPHRGHRNEPAYIPHILITLSEIYNRSLKEVAEILRTNTLRLFPRLYLPSPLLSTKMQNS